MTSLSDFFNMPAIEQAKVWHDVMEKVDLMQENTILKARLAEAERLLDQAADLILGCVEARSPPDLANDIDAFLGVRNR